MVGVILNYLDTILQYFGTISHYVDTILDYFALPGHFFVLFEHYSAKQLIQTLENEGPGRIHVINMFKMGANSPSY